ncbi:TrbC/VirB2 family protein [Sphingobium sp. BYY-5]|uniref:TrbC/VirB2 family protein n=1 Tax=Sphingobium sp. BYY-5 TaxID=2926400 RepID=UPI001FA6D08A|nr:TrbC/VirB2 family protein [Sphingobium sp. BYY-5]MCI4591493.1 TrbC/VirB2 family protein [Sphingobium sp. BYY-5]
MQSTGLLAAIGWIETLLLGSTATIAATLAVAIVGFLLLEGRLDWRRGVRTLIGCFLIFGAPVIAAGLLAPASRTAVPREIAAETEIPPPPPRPPEHYDPYAGAALPQGW